MKIAIFSDQHLPRKESVHKHHFVRVLKQLREECSELWLLGDVFDLFIGPFEFWQKEHASLFEELKLWTKAGKHVLWIEGNHDFHIEAQLKRLGVEHSVDEVVREVRLQNGKVHQVYLAHGDLVDQEDLAYLGWRAFIRHPNFKRSLDHCPEWLASKILVPLAERLSAQSRKRDQLEMIDSIREKFRVFARNKLHQGLDAVILGHSHVADFLVQPEGSFYLNLGSWFGPKTYAVWDTESALPPVLHALNVNVDSLKIMSSAG